MFLCVRGLSHDALRKILPRMWIFRSMQGATAARLEQRTQAYYRELVLQLGRFPQGLELRDLPSAPRDVLNGSKFTTFLLRSDLVDAADRIWTLSATGRARLDRE